jgi:superfamily II DNA or RNA helicase
MEYTYISKNGYVIIKHESTHELISKVKKELIAKPLASEDFNTQNTHFNIFIETKNKIYIPKQYGLTNIGKPGKYLKNYYGSKWTEHHIFQGELLENQKDIYNNLKKACDTHGGGVLQANAGCGKTFLSIKLMSELKGKTMVLVNKIPLMNQWRDEIYRFLPTAKVGFIQGNSNINIADCDIIICMLQSLARIDYPQELFNDINTVFYDECHNFSSKIFSSIFFKLTSEYQIGLSATPNRSDGCDYILNWHIGDILEKPIAKPKTGLKTIIETVKMTSTEYKEITLYNKFSKKEQIQFTSMLSELVEMQSRNRLIIEYIKHYALENRKILVLSDRRDHLFTLKTMLDAESVTFTSGLFLGKMKEKDLIKSRQNDVILATYASFQEGISVADLNTLLLLSPKKYIGHLKNSVKKESFKIEQIVGRIYRKQHIYVNPLIVDFFDNFSVFKSQGYSRQVFYKTFFGNRAIYKESCYCLESETFEINNIENTPEPEPIEEELVEELKFCLLE